MFLEETSTYIDEGATATDDVDGGHHIKYLLKMP